MPSKRQRRTSSSPSRSRRRRERRRRSPSSPSRSRCRATASEAGRAAGKDGAAGVVPVPRAALATDGEDRKRRRTGWDEPPSGDAAPCGLAADLAAAGALASARVFGGSGGGFDQIPTSTQLALQQQAGMLGLGHGGTPYRPPTASKGTLLPRAALKPGLVFDAGPPLLALPPGFVPPSSAPGSLGDGPGGPVPARPPARRGAPAPVTPGLLPLPEDGAQSGSSAGGSELPTGISPLSGVSKQPALAVAALARGPLPAGPLETGDTRPTSAPTDQGHVPRPPQSSSLAAGGLHAAIPGLAAPPGGPPAKGLAPQPCAGPSDQAAPAAVADDGTRPGGDAAAAAQTKQPPSARPCKTASVGLSGLESLAEVSPALAALMQGRPI